MTGRETINSKLAQKRKVLFLSLFIIPIMCCLGIFFSSHSISAILSAFLPVMIALCYVTWLYYQLMSVTCPFCQNSIPWEYGDNFKLLSNDCKFCPCCRAAFDDQVNDESKHNSSEILRQHKLDEQDVNDKTTGRYAVNKMISKNRLKNLIISLAIMVPTFIFGYLSWNSINTTLSLCLVVLLFLLIIKLLINALSYASCPFCGKKILLSIKETDKWKLAKDFLFCQKCGTPIDNQLPDESQKQFK